MKNTDYYISIPLLSEISHTSEKKIRKLYKRVIENECIPLHCIPDKQQEIYVFQYMLRDKFIDFGLINAMKDTQLSLLTDTGVKKLFEEMKMMRKAYVISQQPDATRRLTCLANEYSISYRTLVRKREIYMNNSSLTRALKHGTCSDIHILDEEYMKDRYRTCCYYCRDLIIYLHEKPGKISSAKIFRDIRDADPFPCSKCPYHSGRKADPILDITCKRKEKYMVKPKCEDTVCLIVNRIPEQQDVLAWEGVRSWANHYHYAPAREKPAVVNEVWFSDHKELDIIVKIRKSDGSWMLRRPWITAILDAASDVMVSYVLSLYPNSDCIAECFAQACAFTIDTPYHGLPDYFYIDNGKDFRAHKVCGLPNVEEESESLYLNKNFGECGILEWFGVKTIHAKAYRGRSKTIEPI